MRRKVTLNLDEDFIERLDQDRGDTPRSRWIETLAKPTLALPRQEASRVPSPTRSPASPSKEEAINLGRQLLGKPPLQRPIIQKRH